MGGPRGTRQEVLADDATNALSFETHFCLDDETVVVAVWLHRWGGDTVLVRRLGHGSCLERPYRMCGGSRERDWREAQRWRWTMGLSPGAGALWVGGCLEQVVPWTWTRSAAQSVLNPVPIHGWCELRHHRRRGCWHVPPPHVVCSMCSARLLRKEDRRLVWALLEERDCTVHAGGLCTCAPLPARVVVMRDDECAEAVTLVHHTVEEGVTGACARQLRRCWPPLCEQQSCSNRKGCGRVSTAIPAPAPTWEHDELPLPLPAVPAGRQAGSRLAPSRSRRMCTSDATVVPHARSCRAMHFLGHSQHSHCNDRQSLPSSLPS